MKQTIICLAFILLCFELSAQYNADCLPCLIYNSLDDIEVKATIKHFNLEEGTTELNGSEYISYTNKGIEIIGEHYDGGSSIFYIAIYPQYFEKPLPYGLSANLTLKETKAAFEKAMGGATYSTGMPTTAIGENSVRISDLSQKAWTKAFFNPADNRIVKLVIEPSRMGASNDFSYSKCFKKAKTSPYPKHAGRTTPEKITNLEKLLDDSFNNFRNVKGIFTLTHEDTDVYKVAFPVNGHEDCFIDQDKSIKDKDGQPKRLFRSIERTQMPKLAVEVYAEQLEKKIKALYPTRTLVRNERSKGSKTIVELAMPYSYQGKDQDLKSTGAYFNVYIIYNLAQDSTDKYNLFLYVEKVEL